MIFTLTGLLLGLLQGLRHAFEPDHLAAVSTLLAERRGTRSGLWLGFAWGLGHSASLLVFGLVMIAARSRMPGWMEDACELVVAAMLVVLGARGVFRALARRGASSPAATHAHAHEESTHAHVGGNAWASARRPLLVGLVHGLAGSGALTAIVLAKLSSTALSAAFIVLFGAGAMLGMALLTGVIGWPIAHMIRRGGRGLTVLLASTGAVSFTLGALWGAPIVARALAG